jgi:hypothetical protein
MFQYKGWTVREGQPIVGGTIIGEVYENVSYYVLCDTQQHTFICLPVCRS